MNVTIPVLVTEQKQKDGRATSQIVRPLFFAAPEERAESLQRALNKLVVKIRENLERIGKQARQDELAAWTFAPALDAKMLKFRLNLGAENFDCNYLVVSFDAFGRKIAFTPNVPDVWFDLRRGENLLLRAPEVLDEHFRRLERRDGRNSQNPAEHNFIGKAWITMVEFDINLPQKFEAKEDNLFAFLGMSEKMNGADELRKTGRCLDWLFPDDLQRSTGRDAEIEKLTELLNTADRRPVLLIGKSKVGKTALVHEYVFRAVQRRTNPRREDRNVWLLAPQRLISGMMYIGQWEERLLAIIKEAAKKKHLLYFEDLLGLFFAGQSAASDLSMAQVLKPYLERREVRVLGEITPEAFRVLQETDRSFADLFQILRLAETDDAQTLKIALAVRRELEQKYDCAFQIDVLPTVLDLTRRYDREAAFPGKAAVFLQQLAIKFKQKEIQRDDVWREFEAKSGLQTAFLDDQKTLDRAEVVEQIQKGVIGQKAAVAAAADVISVAKARLNDAARPLGTFLFLGATGVGKTEAAKQIAAYLYGSAEKLLRFDMNEFVSPFDVARLVGTPNAPEGLLTAALRRQPFAVVLLDEIEKAHPDVFNLLLQVLGEGRLTDSLGRTADFTNAIIILTSNLGAREAGVKLGFRQTDESDAHLYTRAAEKFFKPEFFNRLDRIIPFERLRRADVERIAEKLLQKVFRRDGLRQRNASINVAPEAMNLIVSEGYHPQFGARALKRAIERRLTQPVGRQIAALPPDAPMKIFIEAANNQIAARVEEVKPLKIAETIWQRRDFTDVNHELDVIEDALDRIEYSIKHLKSAGEISPQDDGQARYFLIKEYVSRVERMIERAAKWKTSAKSKTPNLKRHLVLLEKAGVDFGKFLGAANLSFQLKTLATENPVFGDEINHYLQDLWRETALLEAVAGNVEKPQNSRAVMQISSDFADLYFVLWKLAELYENLFNDELGLQCTLLKKSETSFQLEIEGAHGFALAAPEAGTHLFVAPNGNFQTLEVSVWEHQKPLPATAPKSVVRIYDARGDKLRFALDFRAGLICGDVLTVREFRAFVLAGLSLPEEIKS